MKNYFVLLVLTSLLFVSCNESATEPESNPEEKSNIDYTSDIRTFFQTDIGDAFSYTIDTLNSQTNSFDNIGTRTVSVDNMGVGADANFFICNESHNFFSNASTSQSKFTITENSVDFFTDTSGVTALIPDSIEIDIKVIFDKVFKLVEFPYLAKKEYQVFNAGANFGTFKFNVLSITGKYIGSEALTLEGFESSFESEKFEYKISVNIPDISNPFVSNVQLYKAYVWFVPTMGITKLEGCKMFINPITGSKFDIADSNKVVRQTLVNYSTN
jgi:hypothetical protein